MLYEEKLQLLIKNALAEDIGDGDHSTLASIDAAATGKAILKIKEDGVLAGVSVAEKIFTYMEPGVVFKTFKKDGDEMKYSEVAFEVAAKVHTILQCERLVLNSMQPLQMLLRYTSFHHRLF